MVLYVTNTLCILKQSSQDELGMLMPFQVVSLEFVLKLETLLLSCFGKVLTLVLRCRFSLPTPLYLQGWSHTTRGPEALWSSADSPGSHM